MSDYVQEALDAAGAAALVQKNISPVLLEYVRRYSPLVKVIPTEKWGSSVYYFNTRTALSQGGAVVDGGARAVSWSTYVQNNFQMKHYQILGAVTGYAEAVTAGTVGSLRAKEMMGASKSLGFTVETSLLWGAGTPTAYGPYPEFDGLDVICSAFSTTSSGGPNPGVGNGTIDNYGGASTWGIPTFSPWVQGVDQNAIDGSTINGGALTYGMLDVLMTLVESNVAEPIDNADYFFLCSPGAEARISQLSYINQRFFNTVEVTPGLIANSYKGVPIIKTSFLSPRTYVFPTVTATATGTGTLNAAYKYKVSAIVTNFGECQASAEASATASTSGISLAFTPPTFTSEQLQPIHYKVYRTAAAGAANTETLLGIVPAAFTDNSGVSWVTTSIFDNGAALVPANGSNVPATVATPATYLYTNPGLKPLVAGLENLYLLSRSADNIVRPVVRDFTPIDVYPTTGSPDALPFAIQTDTTLAVRAPKYIGRLTNVNLAVDATAGDGQVPTQTGYTPTPVVI
jgi:hypothetical protein